MMTTCWIFPVSARANGSYGAAAPASGRVPLPAQPEAATIASAAPTRASRFKRRIQQATAHPPPRPAATLAQLDVRRCHADVAHLRARMSGRPDADLDVVVRRRLPSRRYERAEPAVQVLATVEGHENRDLYPLQRRSGEAVRKDRAVLRGVAHLDDDGRVRAQLQRDPVRPRRPAEIRLLEQVT